MQIHSRSKSRANLFFFYRAWYVQMKFRRKSFYSAAAAICSKEARRHLVWPASILYTYLYPSVFRRVYWTRYPKLEIAYVVPFAAVADCSEACFVTAFVVVLEIKIISYVYA